MREQAPFPELVEIDRLKAELDLCHQSMAKMAKMYPVVDAARRYVGGGEYHERLEARDDLEDALRALDGEL